MSVFGVFTVRIYTHSDWIMRIRMRENTVQKNSEYEHFSRSFINRFRDRLTPGNNRIISSCSYQLVLADRRVINSGDIFYQGTRDEVWFLRRVIFIRLSSDHRFRKYCLYRKIFILWRRLLATSLQVIFRSNIDNKKYPRLTQSYPWESQMTK